MDQYKLIKKIGEGAFSEVIEAVSLKTNKHVAIKCMKKKFESVEKVKKLPELSALRFLSPHQNIVKLIEVLYDEPTGKLAFVFELMDMNLYECLKERRNAGSSLTERRIKYYMYQLLKTIHYIHKKGIFHRDIKPENVLVQGDVIKLADFGSCKAIYAQHPYTDYISTRWYRAPECLMTDGHYDQKMDIWGYGCILFQLIAKFPLFPGTDELDQVNRIHDVLGTPNQHVLDKFKSKGQQISASRNNFEFPFKKGSGLEKLIPKASKEVIDLLYKLLTYDPSDRISAEEALKHDYFNELYSTDSSRDFRATLFNTRISSSEAETGHHKQDPPVNHPAMTNKFKKKNNHHNVHNVYSNSLNSHNNHTNHHNPSLKKQPSKAVIQQDAHSMLPPIHQPIGLEVRVNIYGNSNNANISIVNFNNSNATINHHNYPNETLFKKTLYGMNEANFTKKNFHKDHNHKEDYMLVGKKMGGS